MNIRTPRTALLATGILAVGLAGCSQYVKKDELNAAIQQLQQKQQDQQQQIDAIRQQMQSQFSKYDSQITAMQGRVSVDTVAHFAFNSADLSDQDKPALQDFAATISKYHPNVLVTVEGFADPAGSRAYNQHLGMERAKAVRDFLVSSGISADQVRAVSYGKDANRQVVKGASRDQGADNRRVSLTVDSAGAAASATPTT
ncbi:OmpA family protein [Rhodanobacter sp. DHB23]|uniref:OmpA family protein n=1 Tax=Rhodanobacter sp. DHB23 TaxID=2775923 RepID=UPI00177B4586|nr:OmpA family protein [Rhodanobacter sp. DHB23]MBD8872293.1 OmpA family protein [Rhodanobacter sp. DHB23]